MIIVCPTVPHTGTHFMRKLLADAPVDLVVIMHPYRRHPVDLLALVKAGNPCIIPLRHSDAVRASWKKHGKDLADFAGMSFEEWYQVRDEIANAATKLFYIEIDSGQERDGQLLRINRELGLNLVTDWQPVRQAQPPLDSFIARTPAKVLPGKTIDIETARRIWPRE